MTDRATLEALLARVLEGEGPDRELDGQLALLKGYTYEKRKGDKFAWWRRPDGLRVALWGSENKPPPYTASLDAALTLVPEGWGWAISTTGDFVPCAYGHSPDKSFWVDDTKAATPARAGCALALRARISMAMQMSGGKDESVGN